jgi:hypothetical protein
MKRRNFVVLSTLSLTGLAAAAAPPKVQSLADAMRWLDRMDRAGAPRTTGAWPLAAVLEHLAQSIEMSMDGYPRMRGELFQRTAGSAAFTFFKWRGAMSHGLAEPIPGAPPLSPAAPWQESSARLRRAITRFEAHNAALRPHFAYGVLDKSDFASAHTLHIANHQDEIALA